VRIDRASPISDSDLEAWRTEIRQYFQPEINIHFGAEEAILFPAAKQFPELIEQTDDLCRDHVLLREDLLQVETGSISGDDLLSFAQRLSNHIRKEERHLFEGLQKLMDSAQLAALGTQLQGALKDAEQACVIPNETTRLRSTNPHEAKSTS
jgi:hypothetical protein